VLEVILLDYHALLPRHIAEQTQPERLVLALDRGRLIARLRCVPNMQAET
jgi:hypothetical protein